MVDLLQVWLELYNEPSKLERDTLEAIMTSWFTLGRCGGFNSQNLQVHTWGCRQILCCSTAIALCHEGLVHGADLLPGRRRAVRLPV